ncbi:hypothetical protein Tco_0139072 [Tanacetum coccineum]
MKKTRILTRLYDVTPTIVLRRNLFKARHVTQQDYSVTIRKVYAVTLLLWKDESSESALRHLRSDQGLHSSKNFTRSPREITLILLLYLIVHKPLLLWFRWISFNYRVTLDFGSITGGLDHVNPVIRLPIKYGISRGTRVDMSDDVDISTLTIEQYLALIQDNNISGIVKPKIGDDVEFEINSNFMRELRRKLFKGTIDEDATNLCAEDGY